MSILEELLKICLTVTFERHSRRNLGIFYFWLARDTYDFDFCANYHDSSNVGINFFDESNVPTSEPIMHDDIPSYVCCNEVDSSVDDIHATSQFLSNFVHEFQ